MCHAISERQTTIAALLDVRARTSPGRLAYAGGRDRTEITYGDLGRLGLAWWTMLRAAGMGAGARVALRVESPLAYASSYLSLLSAGVTVVPLDPSMPAAAAARHLETVGADLLVTDQDGEPDGAGAVWRVNARGRVVQAAGRPRHRERPAADRPAVMLLSSGTTGAPKVIPLTEAQLLVVAGLVASHHRLGPLDVGYSPLPLFHVNAQVVGLLATLVAGAGLVLDRRFHHGHWDVVAERGVTWVNSVPAILAILATNDSPSDEVVGRVRFVRTASAPLPVAVLNAFEARCGLSVLETYGMSEAASQVTANPLPRARRRPGSAGLPVGVQVRVVDGERLPCAPDEVGSVEIRGPSVIRHYGTSEAGGRRPAREPDGWLVTGDVGRLDGDGFLHLAGRSDDVINRGGEKVYPREIEEVLRSDPGVADLAVGAQLDPILGQCPVAYVVARAGRDEAELARRLLDLAAARLSPARRPSRLVVVDALPAGATGKVSRRALADWEPDHARVRLDGTAAAAGSAGGRAS